MAFDIVGARAAGYSDEEIAQELESAGTFDVRGALGAGYTLDEIAGEIQGGKAGPTPAEAGTAQWAKTPGKEAWAVPKEDIITKEQAMRFIWPGAKTAKEHFIKGLTPALGMAGATAGAAGGPAGTAMGFAAGERAGRTIETLTGVSEPETPGEAAIETGKSLAFGALPWGVEKAVKGVGAVKGALKGGVRRSVKVPKFMEKLGGKMRPSEAGQAGVKGAQDTYTKVSKIGDELYENAKALAPKEGTLKLDRTYAEIDAILADQSLNEAEKKIARDALGRISPEVRSGARGRMQLTPELEAQIKGDIGILTKPLSFEEAFTLRRDLSKLTKQGGTKSHVAGRLLDVLNEEVSENAVKLGTPETITAFQNAINYWRDVVVPQRNIVKMLGKESFEEIPNLLTTNLRTIEALKTSMPESNFQDVKRGFVSDIFESVGNNPAKVAPKLRELTTAKKELMEAAFSSEELAAMKLAGDPGALIKYLEKHPNLKWFVSHMMKYGVAYGAMGLMWREIRRGK